MLKKSILPKRKLGLVLMSTLIAAIMLTACGGNNEATTNATPPATTEDSTPKSSEPVTPVEKTVTDAMGHTVVIPANPQRIIGSYLEDHLVTLGVTPVAQWSVANGVQDYLATGLKDVPAISYDLPPESVASFTPDLIIIKDESSVQNGLYDQYAKIAPTYVVGTEVAADWKKTLTTIADILGKSEIAEQSIKDYDQKVADTKAKLSESVAQESAAILWLTGKQFFLVDETLSSASVLYADLGMSPPNLVTEIPQASKATWNPISLEKLAKLDADHIFLLNSDKGQADDTTKSSIWTNLPAVKAGHVYELDSKSSWLYSGYLAGKQVMDDTLKFLTK